MPFQRTDDDLFRFQPEPKCRVHASANVAMPSGSKERQARLVSRQRWFYPRLGAYSYFWFSKGA